MKTKIQVVPHSNTTELLLEAEVDQVPARGDRMILEGRFRQVYEIQWTIAPGKQTEALVFVV